MSRNIYKSFLVEGEADLNIELQRMEIRHTIGDLYHDPRLCADLGAQFLELFQQPHPFSLRTALAEIVFARKLKSTQRREAFGVLLKLIQDNPNKYGNLGMLVWNEFPKNVDPARVHEVGKMALNSLYGPLRTGFIMALSKIKNDEAISYLLQAAKDPLIASCAVEELARVRFPQALEICEEALRLPGVLFADALLETQRKLKKRMAKATDEDC